MRRYNTRSRSKDESNDDVKEDKKKLRPQTRNMPPASTTEEKIVKRIRNRQVNEGHGAKSEVDTVKEEARSSKSKQNKKLPVKEVDIEHKHEKDAAKNHKNVNKVINKQSSPVLRQLRPRKNISTLTKSRSSSISGLDNNTVEHMKSCTVSLKVIDISSYVPIYKTLLPSSNNINDTYNFDAGDDHAVKIRNTKSGFKILKKSLKTKNPSEKKNKPSKNIKKKRKPQVSVLGTNKEVAALADRDVEQPLGKQTVTYNNTNKKSNLQVVFKETATANEAGSSAERHLSSDHNTITTNQVETDTRIEKHVSFNVETSTASISTTDQVETVTNNEKHVSFNVQNLPSSDDESDNDFDSREVEVQVDVHVSTSEIPVSSNSNNKENEFFESRAPESVNNSNKVKDISNSGIPSLQIPQIESTPVASAYNKNKPAARSLSYSTFTSPIMNQNYTLHISTPMRVDLAESSRIPANFPVKQHSYLPAYMREGTHGYKEYTNSKTQTNDSLPTVAPNKDSSTQTTLTKYKTSSNVIGLYEDTQNVSKKLSTSNKSKGMQTLDYFVTKNASLSQTLNTPDEEDNVDNYFGFGTLEDDVFSDNIRKPVIAKSNLNKPTRLTLTEIMNRNLKNKNIKRKKNSGKENITENKRKNKRSKSKSPQKRTEKIPSAVNNNDSVVVSEEVIVPVESDKESTPDAITSAPIALFEDPDDKENIVHHKKKDRRSYERPIYLRRNRSSSESTSSDCHESTDLDDFIIPDKVEDKEISPKPKKPRNKMTKKEEAAYEEWAKSFNSMCEDVEANPMIIE